MPKKFFESDSFAQVKAEWDAKLKSTGFSDLEATEIDGVIRPQVFSTKKASIAGPDYYEHCRNILNQFPFKRDIDRVIFEMHTEGRSDREIEAYLAVHSYRPYTHQRINQIIARIKQDFGRM